MMIHAYNEYYVDDAADNLGEFMSYTVNDVGYDMNEIFAIFARSNVGRNFQVGNPKYVTGMSGIELSNYLIHEVTGKWCDVAPTLTIDRDDKYWTGWALAQYQWECGRSFEYLLEHGVTPEWTIKRYIYHEADISKYIHEADMQIEQSVKNEVSMLKRLRGYVGLTQRELSVRSGVNLRMIQLYEQGQNDISKAGYDVVANLASALGCRTEDIVGR